MKRRKPPSWISKYKKDYENGRITRAEIYKRENAEREANSKPLLKFKSVSRALNALGFSFDPLKSAQRQEPKPEVLSSPPKKPCFGCEYYTPKYICVYPHSMFKIYPQLSSFDKDFAEGRCKLKENKRN